MAAWAAVRSNDDAGDDVSEPPQGFHAASTATRSAAFAASGSFVVASRNGSVFAYQTQNWKWSDRAQATPTKLQARSALAAAAGEKGPRFCGLAKKPAKPPRRRSQHRSASATSASACAAKLATLKVDDEKGPSQSARAVTCSGRRASQGTHLKFTDQWCLKPRPRLKAFAT